MLIVIDNFGHHNFAWKPQHWHTAHTGWDPAHPCCHSLKAGFEYFFICHYISDQCFLQFGVVDLVLCPNRFSFIFFFPIISFGTSFHLGSFRINFHTLLHYNVISLSNNFPLYLSSNYFLLLKMLNLYF